MPLRDSVEIGKRIETLLFDNDQYLVGPSAIGSVLIDMLDSKLATSLSNVYEHIESKDANKFCDTIGALQRDAKSGDIIELARVRNIKKQALGYHVSFRFLQVPLSYDIESFSDSEKKPASLLILFYQDDKSYVPLRIVLDNLLTYPQISPQQSSAINTHISTIPCPETQAPCHVSVGRSGGDRLLIQATKNITTHLSVFLIPLCKGV